MDPNRRNMDLLLDMSRKQTLQTLVFVLVFAALGYGVLQLVTIEYTLYRWWVIGLFVGVGMMIDQIFNPDENSTLGYALLLFFIWVLQKIVVAGGAIFLFMLLIGQTYHIKYFEESMPFMLILFFWAMGQKFGYYFEHHRLLAEVERDGPESLQDIDKLKIFLYQVHRRSFLRMWIQRKKALFYYLPSNPWEVTPQQFQIDARLASLDMSKFLKYLRITSLPKSKYITFEQITELDFSRNKISEFSSTIFKIFPNAIKLDLSDNRIKTIEIGKDIDQDEFFTGNVVINFEGNPGFSVA
jgi:hypothetical protein